MCLCVFVHVCVCVIVYACVCVCISACVLLCLGVHVYMCLCVCVHAAGRQSTHDKHNKLQLYSCVTFQDTDPHAETMADATQGDDAVDPTKRAVEQWIQIYGRILNRLTELYFESEDACAYWSDEAERDERARVERTSTRGRFSWDNTNAAGYVNGTWFCCFKQTGAVRRGVPLDK